MSRKRIEEMVTASIDKGKAEAAAVEQPQAAQPAAEEPGTESPSITTNTEISPDTPEPSEPVTPEIIVPAQVSQKVKPVNWEKRYNDNNKYAQEQAQRADKLEK